MTQPRKVLTAGQMREVDLRTTALGIPGIILMENAAAGVFDFIRERYAPLDAQRIVVFCGKGNNGGDGLGIARQIFTRTSPKSLDVLLACDPVDLTGDAAANYQMLRACGGCVGFAIEPRMYSGTLIVDALLGSGLKGPARGKPLEWIREINGGFRDARVIAVDVPSGMASDGGESEGEVARADATVTFTAPHPCHVFAPNRNRLGAFRICPIGTPASMYQDDPALNLALVERGVFRGLLAPRDPDGNKGKYGHVLVVAGSRSKTGAAAMCGMAALRAGAGLVTVAAPGSAIPAIAAHSPELMTEFLNETGKGEIATTSLDEIQRLMTKLTLLAIGPGVGIGDETAGVVRELFVSCDKPMVVDADALNILATQLATQDQKWTVPAGLLRVLTPHPGEMARLTGLSVKEVQADRLTCAREFATERGVLLVLKGEATLIAFPDGQVWVNPTGSPSMATGGTGDVLTGMISGMLAQFPDHPREAVAAAVYLHGRSGELGAIEIGEQAFVATDLLRMLPHAMREARDGKSRLDDPDLI